VEKSRRYTFNLSGPIYSDETKAWEHLELYLRSIGAI
jgi:hypothetical protein